MPCHKLFLNLQWVVPQELKNLDIEVVTITKIYWTFREKVISLFLWNSIQPLSSATGEKGPNQIQHTPSPTVKKFQGLVRSAGLPCTGQQKSTTGKTAVLYVQHQGDFFRKTL